MKYDDFKKVGLELMATTSAVYLSTINQQGFPETRAMLNLRNTIQFPDLIPLFKEHKDDFLIYLTTNTSSEKMKQILANPAGSVYFCNPENFHGLMLAGQIKIISDSHIKHTIWQNGWEIYYPAGKDDPDYSILALSPERIKGWYMMEKFNFTCHEK